MVLTWNLVTYPAIRDRKDLRPLVEPIIGMLNLMQYWDMFAPNPYTSDFWHVMPALAVVCVKLCKKVWSGVRMIMRPSGVLPSSAP